MAPSTTWWLVSTSPSDVSTIPVPAARAPSYPSTVLTFTSPGETFAATADGSSTLLTADVLFAFTCWSMPQATEPMTVTAARLSTPTIAAIRRRRRFP